MYHAGGKCCFVLLSLFHGEAMASRISKICNVLISPLTFLLMSSRCFASSTAVPSSTAPVESPASGTGMDGGGGEEHVFFSSSCGEREEENICRWGVMSSTIPLWCVNPVPQQRSLHGRLHVSSINTSFLFLGALGESFDGNHICLIT